MNAITIWVADNYAAGCPRNGAGRCIGLGATREGAIKACEPWANQAPWFRNKARQVTVTDEFDETDRDYEMLAQELDVFGLGTDVRRPKLATLLQKLVDGGALK